MLIVSLMRYFEQSLYEHSEKKQSNNTTGIRLSDRVFCLLSSVFCSFRDFHLRHGVKQVMSRTSQDSRNLLYMFPILPSDILKHHLEAYTYFFLSGMVLFFLNDVPTFTKKSFHYIYLFLIVYVEITYLLVLCSLTTSFPRIILSLCCKGAPMIDSYRKFRRRWTVEQCPTSL